MFSFINLKAYVLYIFIFVNFSNISFASENTNTFTSGLKHFINEEYNDAESLFSQASGYKARLGQALSNYHLKKLIKARSLFKQSILMADSDHQRFVSVYNAATCSFIIGDYSSSRKLFSDAKAYKPDSINAKEFHELSQYLEKLVLAQAARNNAKSTKTKSSEGKKTISSLNIKFDDDVNLRLEDNESTDSISKNMRLLLHSDRDLLNKLIANGIDAVNLDTSKNKLSFIDLNIKFEFSSLSNASYTSQTSASELWKRIFELEQGYPANLDEAEYLPGIRPW